MVAYTVLYYTLNLFMLVCNACREGKLVDDCTPNCLYSAEYHSGQLALRDVSGAYLSPIGSKAVLKSRSNSVTKDELFTLEDSLPQASFIAALNIRYVSVKQGEFVQNLTNNYFYYRSSIQCVLIVYIKTILIFVNLNIHT